MINHIHNSNLIENIDDPKEDKRSLKAWEYLKDQPVISQPVLLELHKMITRKQLSRSEAGHYRKVGVHVGGRMCPHPMIAQGQIYGWLNEMFDSWRTLDPKDMHIRFEKIHPFVDGNGRTGRMLMWWHEMKLGYIPTLIDFSNRRAYYDWFKESDDGDS